MATQLETTVASSISVKNLHKNYGHVKALRGISLDVKQGQIFGLLGANGAGKTTLIRILIGSTKSTDGHAQVIGLDPTKDLSALRQQIGYMPQSPALYEDLSARANVRFFAQAHHLDHLEARIDEVLNFVDLEDRQHDAVYGFSGGMRQRLSLACALVHQPRVLFLDEPTTGVDPKLREAFWKHFRNLTENGVTILVSTHQMDEAFHCDELAIMRAGEILACDTPKQIVRRGRTTINIWQNGDQTSEIVTNYPDQLPTLLQKYELGAVDRIEINEDTMEDVVLSLINQTTQPIEEGA
jgi:ABC-2 type transport system ATP-binding protein